MSLDSLLESALEVSLASHPNPQSVYGLAEKLRHQRKSEEPCEALLDNGHTATSMLMGIAAYYEANEATDLARCLQAFAARLSLLEAAGQ